MKKKKKAKKNKGITPKKIKQGLSKEDKRLYDEVLEEFFPMDELPVLSQETWDRALDNIHHENPDMITAMIFSVLAATELGETRLFGELPFDHEMDRYADTHGLRRQGAYAI